MGLRIQSKRDVIVITLGVSLLTTALSEFSIFLLYQAGGSTAFHLQNAIIFAAFVPILISVPIAYYMTNLSLNLAITQKELQRLANTDPLTQLPNRRSFFQAAEDLLNTAKQQATSCSLLVIDADYFKDLNDSYGHAAGDRALVAIADVLREKFRHTDLICRVGGEEFAVLVNDMNASDAQVLAQRVVEAVAGSPIFENDAIIEFSVSCGIADTSYSYQLGSLFKSADDAMYTAKARGRNRVVLMEVAA